MATVKLVLRKDKKKKNGEFPICLRIIQNRKSTFISLKQSVLEKDWDKSSLKVKSKVTNSRAINHFLHNKLIEVESEILRLESQNLSFDPKVFNLKNNLEEKEEIEIEDVFSFIEGVLDEYSVKKQFGTHRKNLSVFNKIKEFYGGENLPFTDFNIEFLKKYEQFLIDVKGNKTNTIWKDMSFLRKIANEAEKNEMIEKNPFKYYKLKKEESNREFLSFETIQQIDNLSFPENSKRKLHKDMFIFSCYAGGIRVSDVLSLKWKDIENDRVSFKMKKTNDYISFPLPKRALEIVNEYRTLNKKLNPYIFPIFDSSIDTDVKTNEMSQLFNKKTSLINNTLKEIKKILGINKNLSFHISRHTFATSAITRDIPLEIVSKILGHTDTKTTQIYAKIVNSKMDEAMNKFN